MLRVVYLVFNEGHAATRGELRGGGDPARAAARAADARRGRGARAAGAPAADRRALGGAGRGRRARRRSPTRTGALWDRGAIAEGVAVLERALRLPRPGSYAIQAAIAALHDQAPTSPPPTGRRSPGSTRELARHDPSPVVARQPRGRGRVRGRAGGGARRCSPTTRGSTATSRCTPRASELLRRAGDAAGAERGAAAAIELSANEAERDALRRLGERPATGIAPPRRLARRPQRAGEREPGGDEHRALEAVRETTRSRPRRRRPRPRSRSRTRRRARAACCSTPAALPMSRRGDGVDGGADRRRHRHRDARAGDHQRGHHRSR